MRSVYLVMLALGLAATTILAKESKNKEDKKKTSEVSYEYIASNDVNCPKGDKCVECCNNKYKTCIWPLTLDGNGKINYSWASNMTPVLSIKTAEAFKKKGVKIKEKSKIQIEAFKENGDISIYATANQDGGEQKTEIVRSLSSTCGDGLEKCKEGCK